MSESNPNIIRIPIKEVDKFLKSKHRPEGDDTHIYVFGRKLQRKNYPNGILAEIDKKNKVYIIRPA